MRFAFVAFALVACSSDPPPPADAAPDAPDVCACVDTGPPMDVPPDAPKVDVPAPQDAPTIDADPRCTAPLTFCFMGCHDLQTSPLHCGRCDNPCPSGSACRAGSCVAVPQDAGADVVGDAPRCPSGLTGTCGGRSINFQMGFPQSDGTTLHCGRCGNTCAAGSFCEVCVCTR